MWAIVRFIAGLLGVSAPVVAIVGGIIGMGAVWIAWKVHTNHYIAIGEARCDARWQAAVKKEDDRRRQEQEEARREAEEEVSRLLAEQEKLNAELERLQAESDAAPNAGACGLGADGVQRIDRIH